MGMIINPYAFGGFTNNQSVDMNGSSDYATVADDSAFSFTNGAGQDTAWTSIIWFKRVATGVNSTIIAKYNDVAGNNREWYIAIIGSTLRLLLINSTGSTNVGRTAPMSTTGSWVALAAVNDGTEVPSGIKIYTITGGTVTQIDTGDLATGVYAGMSNTASPLRMGTLSSGGTIWFWNGKQFHPQLWTGVISTTDLATIGANPYKDVRTFTFGGTPISAWHINNGIWTDYVNGRNATFTGCTISTDIP